MSDYVAKLSVSNLLVSFHISLNSVFVGFIFHKLHYDSSTPEFLSDIILAGANLVCEDRQRRHPSHLAAVRNHRYMYITMNIYPPQYFFLTGYKNIVKYKLLT